jgi:hypothetical protein
MPNQITKPIIPLITHFVGFTTSNLVRYFDANSTSEAEIEEEVDETDYLNHHQFLFHLLFYRCI